MSVRSFQDLLLVTLVLLCSAPCLRAEIPADLHLAPFISSGLSDPLAIRSANDGSGRLFVVERGGTIRVVVNGVLQSTPYYSRAVDTSDVERGLLGLAFDPDFRINGTFYIVYTASGSNGEILRRLVASNPAANVFAGSDSEVMRIPLFYNHNGGDIHFGQDNYLYWSTGSGTGSFDPNDLAQNLWKKTISGTTYFLMGKVLRLDVRSATPSAAANMCGASAGQAAPYAIPPGNPYAGAANTCAEIWAYGFRNPWRISIDRQTGDLWVADVGEGSWEEVSLRTAAGAGNRNYGYPQCEGNHHGRPSAPGGNCPTTTGTVAPVMEYSHANSRCSVTGGVRYRGPITPFRGHYVFADACSSELFIGTEGSGGSWSFVTRSSGIAPGYGTLSGFGEDQNGDLFVVDHQNGRIWRFASAASDPIFGNGFDP
ncbi:MAG TPA: PQQ-dependent sugar dehydrogenase [Dokdonella sp.]|uniref:PQQ-dependent sugar dehydrogenase n=1 Tax=Dokdonella sp. TaxID=2291710 RepID=UPI0025B8A03B|nr:PQQ-dependent sugar dehydrogenase [Dokdonella sp.]MBX3691651.1 PQQ-dependent sugar dehydrogenase [Dokdonella sp.]HNR91629.1 PQQ-dependent sugar dehydrogenase [Dokdonella sp.]